MSVTDYLAARAEFEKLDKKLERLGKEAKRVGELLERAPALVHWSDAPATKPVARGDVDFHVLKADWLSPDQWIELLQQVLEAKKKAIALYNKLPPDQQEGVLRV